jgi:DNA-binding transcriptional MocR family regulator
VKKLRQALEDSAERPRFVETLPRVGYRFMVPVEWTTSRPGLSLLSNITSGAQQALDLIGRFLVATGDQVWMEDPGYSRALQTLRATGARIVPVPVDEGE